MASASVKVSFNDRLRHVWPEHRNEELTQLEASCLTDPDHRRMPPIIIWPNGPGGNTIVDGYHQYEIRKKHGLEIRTEPLDFEDIKGASWWAFIIQAGRRNVTASQIALAATELAIEGPVDAERLSKMAGISPRTLASAAKVSKNGSAAVVNGVKNGSFSVHDAEGVVDLPKGVQSQLVRSAERNGITLKQQRRRKLVDVEPVTNGHSNGKAKPKAKAKARLSGSETASSKLQKQAIDILGQLVRVMDKLDIKEEYALQLEEIEIGIKDAGREPVTAGF